MSIEVLVKDDKNTIKTFVSKEFTIDIKVNPDKIKYESANTATAIRGSKLVLESKEFEIVSSTVGTIDKNSVDLGEFKYAYDGIGFNVGTSFDVTLKIRALKEGSYNENKSFNKLIKLYHKNASGNDAKVKIDDADNKLNVIVDKVNYENPKIMGGEFLTNKQENGEGNKIVAFGELLELNYHLIPSEIMTSEKVQNTQGDGSRKLIYVLDESTLSKNNEGESKL